MSESPVTPSGSAPGVPAPPPDDQNPAIIFAGKTFWSTVIGTVLFVGTVILFIL